ncbi:MAG: 5-dehydro-2-deoxygluconokinase [Rhodospirillales bacterium]|nr:5-dehydro-2-deoxygluconokinase [Rhodospirillales bacterium]
MTDRAEGRKFDLVTIGRAAVDIYGEQIGGRLEDMASFAKYLGGCPANIAVGAARLGLRVAMITRVGDEHMGRFVRETLAAEGVDTGQVKTDPQRLTGLVILGIRDKATFPLIFYRENCADMALEAADIDPAVVASARALLVTGTHFSTARTDEACRTAMRHARAAGTRIVLDIDYRPVLWGLTGHGLGEERYVASDGVSKHLQSIAPDCDLIVGTEEEIHIASGATDTLAALRRLRELSAATLVVKRGPMGCAIFPGPIPQRIEDGVVGRGFPVEVFNVLGAGDGFMAGLLSGWLRGLDWPAAAARANACGALVVSRHGCAPAMPTAAELDDFLARADGPTRLHDDPRINYLHRVTTRRRQWPEICALAFDHRRQLEDLAAAHRSPIERIPRFKALVAEALRQTAPDIPGAGAIIDDRFGREPLSALTGSGLWLARPVELPGSRPLEFEAGPDIALTLRTWPVEHVAKCLVAYHPDDEADLRRTQEDRVAALFRACIATGREFLLEVIPPRRPGDGPDILARALKRFYDIGIQPDWWKLPPAPDRAAWTALGDVIRRHDPHCRGIVILGLDSPEDDLARGFAAAAGEETVRGFAVGRNIHWKPAEAWFASEADDATTIDAIAINYRRIAGLWRSAKGY